MYCTDLWRQTVDGYWFPEEEIKSKTQVCLLCCIKQSLSTEGQEVHQALKESATFSNSVQLQHVLKVVYMVITVGESLVKEAAEELKELFCCLTGVYEYCCCW